MVDDRRPVLDEDRPPSVDDVARLAVRCRGGSVGWSEARSRGGHGAPVVTGSVRRQILPHDVLLVRRRQRLAQLYEIGFRSELRHVIQYGADAIDATLLALKTTPSLAPR